MTTCIILGDKSDIAKDLKPLMIRDGWQVSGWNRDTPGLQNMPRWNVLLIALGRVAPVGFWAYQDEHQWEAAIESNILLPVRLLRRMWDKHEGGAHVVFMAGANPNRPMLNYTAYSTGKMALLKFVEHCDLETPDLTVTAMGPGTVLTKIHKPTLNSGLKNEVLERVMQQGEGTPINRIWECLQWICRQPKAVVGGRNICVSDSEDWSSEKDLARLMQSNNALFKLRRVER